MGLYKINMLILCKVMQKSHPPLSQRVPGESDLIPKWTFKAALKNQECENGIKALNKEKQKGHQVSGGDQPRRLMIQVPSNKTPKRSEYMTKRIVKFEE